MKHTIFSFLSVGLMTLQIALAAPSQTTKHIKIDQFGYFPNARKVAVITDPQAGFNAAESFNPSTGTNQYQIRRWADDAVVWTGTIVVWNSGSTHAQSGDKGWYFDFSALTTVGSYYVFDVGNAVGSYRFDIGANVYDEILKQAVRMFYYQRINFAKQTPYTDAKWADAAAYEGPNQDKFARLYSDPSNAATARDLRGGWMDAGDANKYTTFAERPVIQLIEAYRQNPTAFKDNYNLPESGNGVPDVLDELKYELDFLKKMQDATGTNGFLLKIGNIDYNIVQPPSADTRPRYYVGECTSATLAGAAMLAAASQGFKLQNSLLTYANNLVTRAEAAWNRAKVTTSNFTVFETNCDTGVVKSGDADRGESDQKASALVTAVYLYEATGKAEYKTYVENNYTTLSRYTWWGPYDVHQHLAMLRYTTLAGASSTVVSNIRTQKSYMDYQNSLNNYTAATDLYRAYMSDAEHTWGSNDVRSNCGNMNLDFIYFNINATNHPQYQEVAEQYLHWLHGINPFAMVMLSNMNDHNAENSISEIYHYWFTDGSLWDNVQTSYGPPPGYLVGGPNKNFNGSISGFNPATEPAQKCYRELNTTNDIERSWQLTEPAIYYQTAYISLLSRLIGLSTTVPDNGFASTAIYTDALASDWQNWSWGGTQNFAQTTPVKVGSQSLEVNYTDSYGGLSLRKGTAINASLFRQLRFWVYSTQVREFRLYTQSADDSGSSTQVAFSTDANQWKEIVITKAQLGNPSAIKRVNFQIFGNTGSVTFDEIVLESCHTTNLVLSTNFTSGSIKRQTNGTIEANNKVVGNNLNATYDSAKSVTLQAGFEARANATTTFRAQTGGCANN
ncbi:MAG: glycoside hydrolase family 9 protein [Spirosomaceae bacterium]|nr:glycoside hydrolase family 9 protein [Spirosomataceae bacterium]